MKRVLVALLLLGALSCQLNNALQTTSKKHSSCSKTRKIYSTAIVAAADSVPLLISLASGSVAGALGVGVAYPFDSLKTKSQTYAAKGGEKIGLGKMASLVLQNEGISGF